MCPKRGVPVVLPIAAMLLALLTGCQTDRFQQILDRQEVLALRLQELERSITSADAENKARAQASELRWAEFASSLRQPIPSNNNNHVGNSSVQVSVGNSSVQVSDPYFVRSAVELSNNAKLVDLLKAELDAYKGITQDAIKSGADTVTDLNAKRTDLLKSLDENTAEIEKRQIELAQAIAGYKAGLDGAKLKGLQESKMKLLEFKQEDKRRQQAAEGQSAPAPSQFRPNG